MELLTHPSFSLRYSTKSDWTNVPFDWLSNNSKRIWCTSLNNSQKKEIRSKSSGNFSKNTSRTISKILTFFKNSLLKLSTVNFELHPVTARLHIDWRLVNASCRLFVCDSQLLDDWGDSKTHDDTLVLSSIKSLGLFLLEFQSILGRLAALKRSSTSLN